MSIIVEGPDGAEHEFPVDTDPTVIKAAMARHYGPPQSSNVSYAVASTPGVEASPSAGGELNFDDLIPRKPVPQGQGDVLFDDLIPQKKSAWQDQPAAARLSDVMRSVAHGATFGASPRIAAALEAATGLGGQFGDYSGNLARRQNTEEAYSAAHPWLSGIGNLTGGVAGALAAAPLMGAAAAPGAGAPAVPLLTRMAQGAGVGAGLGGFQGAMNSHDLTDVPQTAGDATWGAGTGALLGGVMPAVGAGLGAGYSAIKNRFSSPAELRAPQTRILADALMADNPATVQARLGDLGPDASLADSGPSLLGTAQGAALNSDRARETLAQTLLGRDAGAPTRIKSATEASFGPYAPPASTAEALKDTLARVDAENYGSAFYDPPPAPVDTSRLLKHLDEQIPLSEGMEKKALVNLRGMLMQPNPAKTEAVPMPEYDSVVNAPMRPPQNLAEFLKGLGGVKDEGGDLEHMGLGSITKGLINKASGVPMDKAREAAAEAGYLGPHIDEAMANTTPNDLIDALSNHPTYSVHDEDALNAIQAAEDAQASKPQGDLTTREYKNFLAGKAQQQMEPDLVPKTNAINLHKIKQELDNVINYDQPGLGVPAGALSRQQAALQQARGMLNDLLEDQVGGYKYANRQSAALRQRLEALQEGGRALDTGKTSTPPEALATRLRQLRPDARGDLAAGARGEIERQLATNPDDLRAGLNLTKGPEDWNRAKLGLMFGEEPTQSFVNMLDREQTFRDTLKSIVDKSEHAQQTGARDAMAPSIINVPLTKHGAIASALRMLPLGDRSGSYPAVAEGLAAQGETRDALVKTLLGFHEQQAQNAAIRDQAARGASSLANGLVAVTPPVAAGNPEHRDRLANALANNHLKEPAPERRNGRLWITH